MAAVSGQRLSRIEGGKPFGRAKEIAAGSDVAGVRHVGVTAFRYPTPFGEEGRVRGLLAGDPDLQGSRPVET